MDRSKLVHCLNESLTLQLYELDSEQQQQHLIKNIGSNRASKKWWIGFCCTSLMVLFLLYMPVYHQLQTTTRIGETLPGDLVVGIAGWNYNTSRDVRQYVLPGRKTTLLQPSHLCTTPLFLMIIVCSAVDNFEIRNVIRKSWGSETIIDNLSVHVVFLLGQIGNETIQEQLVNENNLFGDLIQERFYDTYNNLTLKSVMLLKWVDSYCLTYVNRAQFVMKTDDDMYVNIPNLVKLLKPHVKTKRLLIGSLFTGARPRTDTSDKWYAPKYMYPDSVYPNYLSGTGYVMSIDTVSLLYKAALSIPLFHLEDVYITGMCARLAKIKPKDNSAFHYNKIALDQCTYKDIITAHHVDSEQMYLIYNLLHQNNIKEICNKTTTTAQNTTKKHRWKKNK